jgi:hypothetical protein
MAVAGTGSGAGTGFATLIFANSNQLGDYLWYVADQSNDNFVRIRIISSNHLLKPLQAINHHGSTLNQHNHANNELA